MRILHTVEFYPPSVGGMQEAVRQISERLVKLGHEVTVATSYHPQRSEDLINGVKVRPFKVSGNLVRGIEGNSAEYERFLLDSDFDVVSNFAAQQWATDIALPILSKIKGKKAFVPTGFSGLRDPDYAGYFDQMKLWIKNYDTCVFLSEFYQDYGWAISNGVERTCLIPNGAARDEFEVPPSIDIRSKLRIPRNNFLVLMVGSFSGVKGHVEAIEIFKKSRLKHATLLIVGNDRLEGSGPKCLRRAARFNAIPQRVLDHSNIKVVSLTRDKTVAAYHAADMFLFPSQIECSPLVIYEAMASRTPFLATNVGNVRELARFGGGILLEGTVDSKGFTHADIVDGAEKLRSFRNHPQAIKDMGDEGRKAWIANFTWEEIAFLYEQLYRGALNE